MSAQSGSPVRSLSDRWFELLLVTMVLTVVLVAHHLAGGKQVLLHFFYLPVIVAAHYLGRRLAGTTALLAVLAVGTFALLDPGRYMYAIESPLILLLTLCAWGGFLGLNAILIGTLCDQRAAHIQELREAHVGIIEILSKYLQAADRYTKSHSVRVADLAEEIARQMKLEPREIEDVRVGALLHDIGKVEISTHLIQKAAALTDSERAEIASHTFQGAELVRSLGSILAGAVPLVLHHHDPYTTESGTEGRPGREAPIGAGVIAVADAYDAIVTDRPYRTGRTPQEAIAVIREGSGTQFAPEVVSAFERVMISRIEEWEADKAGGAEPRVVTRPMYNVEIPASESAQHNPVGLDRVD